MATYMWNCKVKKRRAVKGLRDDSPIVRAMAHGLLYYFWKKKLLPAKAWHKSDAKNEQMLDVLVEILKSKKSFKAPWPKKTNATFRGWSTWAEAALRAELGGPAPAPLEQVILALTKAYPDAAVTKEDRFAVRLIRAENGELDLAYRGDLWDDFDPGEPKHDLVFWSRISGGAPKTGSFELEVVAEPKYLEVPKSFDSTAW